MLSAGEVKGAKEKKNEPTGNVFHDSMELPKEVEGDVQYPSVAKLDEIDCKGCPAVVDEYFTNVHEPMFYDLGKDHPKFPNTTWVQYFKPGEYAKKKKRAEEILKDPKAPAELKEKAKLTLKMYPLPADPAKADPLLRRMQARPDLFKYAELEQRYEVADGRVKEVAQKKEKPLKIGRSADGKKIFVFENDKVIEKKCPDNKAALFNTLRGIRLATTEIRQLVMLLEAGEKDFCVDNGNGKTIAIAKDYPLASVDEKFAPLIATHPLFSSTKAKQEDDYQRALRWLYSFWKELPPESRGEEIAEALKNAFEERRDAKGDKLFQKIVQAFSVVVGSASIFMMWNMIKMQRKAMGVDKEPMLPRLRDMTQEVRLGKKYMVGPSMAHWTKELEKHFVKPRGHTVLIAEPGVGKTTAYEALAQAIANGKHSDGSPINPKLQDAVMYEINVQNDILGKGGTQYVNVVQQLVGQLLDEATAESQGRDTSSFKSRIKKAEKAVTKEVRGRWVKILQEARRTAKQTGRPVILFIDEIHTIFKLSKTAQGGAGAEEAFKTRMARDWNVHIGGASTKKEWEEASRDNPALKGRLVPIDLPVPTPQEALELFREIRGSLKERYGREVSEEALREVIRLSEKATHTNFPRKGWDLLDYTAADLDSAKSTAKAITAEHVQAAFRNMHMGSLNRELTDAIRAASEPRLSEAEIMEIERGSIEKALGERIRGFDALPDDVKGKVGEVLRITWRNMKPEFRVFMTPEGTPQYVVPDPFFDLTLEKAAEANGLALIPEGQRVSRPGGKGGRGPGGSEGPGRAGGTPPAGEPPPRRGPPPPPPARAGRAEAAPRAPGRPRVVHVDGERGSATVGMLTGADFVAETPRLARWAASLVEGSRKALETFGGFGPILGIFGAKETALHVGAINENQSALFDGAATAAFLIGDAGFAITMLGGWPGAKLGEIGGSKVADTVGKKTGIETLQEGKLGNKWFSLGTGIAGFGASVHIANKSETFRNFHAATAAGTKELAQQFVSTVGSVGMRLENGARNMIPAGITAMAGVGLASAKAGLAVAGEAVIASAAATSAVVAAEGVALGALIHYSGAGKYIGTEQAGEALGDAAYSIVDDWKRTFNWR